MGIAIGVAIDEGIAKDIHAAFTGAGYDLPSLVSTSFNTAMGHFLSSQVKGMGLGSNAVIHIRSIGFKTTSGDGDPVVSNVDGFIEYLGEITALAREACPTLLIVPVQLDRIKASGDVSYSHLDHHLVGLFECWVLKFLNK